MILTLMSLMVLMIPVEQHFTRLVLLISSMLGFVQMLSQFSAYHYQTELSHTVYNTFWQTSCLEMLVMVLVAIDLVISHWLFLSSLPKDDLRTARQVSFLTKVMAFLERNQEWYTFLYLTAKRVSSFFATLYFYQTSLMLLFRIMIIICFSLTCAKIGLSFYYANNNYQQKMNTKVKIEPKFYYFRNYLESLLLLAENRSQCQHYNKIKNEYFKNINSNHHLFLNNPFCLNEQLVSYLFA